MNYNNLFAKAKEEGIEALEITIKKINNIAFSYYNDTLDSSSISNTFALSARGIYQGKMGTATSEKIDKNTIDFIISSIKNNASIISSNDQEFIFPGSDHYVKKNIYNKELASVSVSNKMDLLKKIIVKVKEDKRITATESSYQEATEETTLLNSYGLKLSSKTNYALIYVAGYGEDAQGETKNGYSLKFSSSLDDFHIDEIAQEVINKTISQFGSAPCKSKTYSCVFNPDTTATMLEYFISNIYSDEIQKGTSLLKGKLNQKVCSSKITILEKPLEKNIFFRSFDDEGVATSNKTIVKNGILQTYLYNLKTANKDGVQTTGNASRHGASMGIGVNNIIVKPGRVSEEDLIKKVNNGLYINDVSGLHAGMNPQSGNFSLIAQGFLIEDGKLTRPISLITVAGNLFDFFNNVVGVANNNTLQPSSYSAPSIMVKKVAVSGE